MIEVTPEMPRAFEDAAGECAGLAVPEGLAAVLAIVERDYMVAKRVRRLPTWPGYREGELA